MTRAFATVLAVCALLAPAAAVAQRDFSKVEITTRQVADGLYVLEGAGGNMAVSVGEDAVFLVDDQYAPLTEKIVAAIAKLTPKPVRFVLNTHWHGDHTGGNENLGRAGAIVVAHDNVRRRMSVEQFNEIFGSKTPPSSRGSLPVVTFSGGTVTFHLNGEELRAIHAPKAHTDGDTLVHFVKADVIHSGDIVWNGLYPFIDVSSGGSVEGTIAACDLMLRMSTERTRIIAGHGPSIVSPADVRAYRDMLATVSGRVKALVAQGKTLEDIKAAKVSADFDDKWGKGFIKPERFAEMLARPLLKR